MRVEKTSLDALTGLRFVAALFVAYQHCGGHLGVDEFRTPAGNFAVAFFFMLSGFILTYAYQGRLQKPSEFYRFWFARFARIWPLHLLTTLICVLGLARWTFMESDADRFQKLFANLLLVQSWIPKHDWIFSINAVSWSISVEAFFYLMFPFCFWGGYQAFKKKYAAIILASILGIGALAYAEANSLLPAWCHPDAILHSNPLVRLLEFASGMFLGFKFNALPAESKKLGPKASAVAEIAAIAFVAAFAYAVSYRLHILAGNQINFGRVTMRTWLQISFPALAFAGVVWSFARSQGPLAYLLSRPLMVFLGEISFSFYMIHQFVILKLDFHFPNAFIVVSPVATFGVVLAVSIAASILLYRLVELPAKSLLLNLYDRKWQKAREFATQFAMTELRSPLIAALLLGLVGFATYAMEFGTFSPTAPPQVVNALLKNHGVGKNGIKFDCGATLHAVSFSKNIYGDLKMTTVWTQDRPTSMKRFLHLCNEKGEILGYGQQRPTSLKISPNGNYCVDKVTITEHQLGNATRLGFGFHDPKLGMANVEEGKRSLNGHRLDIALPGTLTAQLEKEKQLWAEMLSQQTESEQKAIEFDDCADLLNMRLKPLPKGLLVQTQWRCKNDLTHHRFLHICDHTGKILRHAKQENHNLHFKANNGPWIDQVYIPYADLNEASFCGIGFYSKETGSVKVSDGPRDMHNCRLQLKLPWDQIRMANGRQKKKVY